jgi:DNA-binding PucR family transcriptional regulator
VSDIHPGAEVLARLSRPDLLLTARAVLEHSGNISAAAAELHVHRTTLHYRLERIDALIGVDIRNGVSHADLLMAIRLDAYRRAAG